MKKSLFLLTHRAKGLLNGEWDSSFFDRRLGVPFVVAFVTLWLLNGNPFSLLPNDFMMLNHFPDDAFYYFQICRNASQGKGWTFDGIHVTNGVQPLWAWLITPLFSFSKDPLMPLRWISLINYFLFSVSAEVFYRTVKRWFSRPIPFLIWSYWVLYPSNRSTDMVLNGMESSLYLLALLLFIHCLARFEANSSLAQKPLNQLGMGLLGVFCFLARLDALILVGLYALFLCSALLKKHPLKEVMLRVSLFLLPSLTTLPYFYWNYQQFGHTQPISGMVKHTRSLMIWKDLMHSGDWLKIWQSVSSSIIINAPPSGILHTLCLRCLSVLPDNLLNPLANSLTLLFMIALIIWTLKLAVHYRLPWIRSGSMHLFLLFLLLHVLIYRTYFLFQTGGWHGAPLLILSAYIFGTWLQVAQDRWLSFIRPQTFVAGVLLLLTTSAWAKAPPPLIPSIPRAISWMMENLPPQAQLAGFNSGILGYFLPQSVINLDGLANSSEIVPYIRNRRMTEYVCTHGIDYLVDIGEMGPTLPFGLGAFDRMDRWERILSPPPHSFPTGNYGMVYIVGCSNPAEGSGLHLRNHPQAGEPRLESGRGGAFQDHEISESAHRNQWHGRGVGRARSRSPSE